MASLQKKGDAWYCQFYYHGKRHTFGVGNVSADEAEAKAHQVDYLLLRLRQDLLHLPQEWILLHFFNSMASLSVFGQ